MMATTTWYSATLSTTDQIHHQNVTFAPEVTTFFSENSTWNTTNSTDYGEKDLSVTNINWYILALSAIPLITLIGNGIVLMTVCCHSHLHSTFFFMLASLATSDILNAILVMSLAIMKTSYNDFPLPDPLCEVWQVLQCLFTISKLSHIILGVVDCFLAIVAPIKHKLYNTFKNNTLGLLAVWVMSVLLCVPLTVSLLLNMSGHHMKTLHGCGEFTDAVVLSNVIPTYIFPSFCISFMLIFITLKYQQENKKAKYLMYEKENQPSNGFTIANKHKKSNGIKRAFPGLDMDNAECQSIDSYSGENDEAGGSHSDGTIQQGVNKDPNGHALEKNYLISKEETENLKNGNHIINGRTNQMSSQISQDSEKGVENSEYQMSLNGTDNSDVQGLSSGLKEKEAIDDNSATPKDNHIEQFNTGGNNKTETSNASAECKKMGKEQLNEPLETSQSDMDDTTLLSQTDNQNKDGLDNAAFDLPLSDMIQVKIDRSSTRKCDGSDSLTNSAESLSCGSKAVPSNPNDSSCGGSLGNVSDDSQSSCRIPRNRRSILRHEGGGSKRSRKSVKFASPVTDDSGGSKRKKIKREDTKRYQKVKPNTKGTARNQKTKQDTKHKVNTPHIDMIQRQDSSKGLFDTYKHIDTISLHSNVSLEKMSDSDSATSATSCHSYSSTEYMAKLRRTQGLRLSHRVNFYTQNLMLVTAMFIMVVIFYLPLTTMSLYVAFCSKCFHEMEKNITLSVQWIAFSVSMLNPIVYLTLSKSFRNSCMELFHCV